MQNYQFLFETFTECGNERGLTVHLSMQYIEDIVLTMDYIAAERVPSWSQHLWCFIELLCYAFAYDYHNYTRCGPVYVAEIVRLT